MGHKSFSWGGALPESNRVSGPIGLTFDASGYLWVADDNESSCFDV